MNKILIALDYDPTAEKVAEAGYALARAMQAEVILLHVLADTMYYMPVDYFPVMGFTGIPQTSLPEPLNIDELKKGAQLFLDASKQHLGDDNIKTIVIEGDFAETILTIAKEQDVSILVVGSHSRSGLEKILMGSVIEKLLHDSNVPLYIVPTKIKEK